MKKNRAEQTALRIAKAVKPSPALQAFKKGGKAKPQARKGKPHPALNIPGVHIRTAEAGEPIFSGGK